MNFQSKRIFQSRCVLLSVSLVLSSAILGACASVVTAIPAEKVVTDLANQRWKYLIASDYAKAYEYTAPSYRALVDFKTYEKQFAGGGVIWTDAKTSKVSCSQEKCDVTVDVTGTALAGTSKLTRTVPINEVWVLEKGQWWQFQKS